MILNFGKYQGQSINEVPRDYQWWLFCNLDSYQDGLRREVGRLLGLNLEDWQPIDDKFTFSKVGKVIWAITKAAPTIMYTNGPDGLIDLVMSVGATKAAPMNIGGLVFGYENVRFLFENCFPCARATSKFSSKEGIGRWSMVDFATDSSRWLNRSLTADEWRNAMVYDDTEEIMAV